MSTTTLEQIDLTNNSLVNQEFRNLSTTTDKYQYVSTKYLLSSLKKYDYVPTGFQSANPRNIEKVGYEKHLVTLTHTSDLVNQNHVNEVPQILLFNSYSGDCSVRLYGGFFRFSCANDLVIGNKLRKIFIPHLSSDCNLKVEFAISSTVETLNSYCSRLLSYKSTNIGLVSRYLFAYKARKLRFDTKLHKVSLRSILSAKRPEDDDNTLWNVFNRVQENLIKGGLPVYNKSSKRWGLTRSIKSAGSRTELNRSLWSLMESFHNPQDNLLN